MDAPYYSGADDRDWPSVDDPVCEVCGAEPDEPCAADCTCWHCEIRRAWRLVTPEAPPA